MAQREAQKQQTRARLVEAAVASFRTLGYAATTVEDIAAAAGVTRATFYLHFESKFDVYGELRHDVGQEIADLHERLPTVVASGDRAGIRTWLADSFRLWEHLKEFADIQEQVSMLHTEVRDRMTAHFNDAVESMTAALAEKRPWDEGECRVRAMLAYAQLQNAFRHWRMGGWGDELDRALEVMTDMWVAALVGLGAPNGSPARRRNASRVTRTAAG